MKNILLFCLVFILNNSIYGQVISSKNIIIQPYFGGPIINSDSIPSEYLQPKSAQIGIFGLMGEYFISEEISLGFDANYLTTNISYASEELVQNPITLLDETILRQFEKSSALFRMHCRINYHFYTQSTRWNSYAGIGVGLKYEFNSLFIDGVRKSSANQEPGVNDFSIGAYSLRLCLGTRYFITPNLGITGEIGLGGGILRGGICYKFNN